MESCIKKEITRLQNTLSDVGLDEVVKVGPLFEELRAFFSVKEEEQACFYEKHVDKGKEERMSDQRLIEEEEA